MSEPTHGMIEQEFHTLYSAGEYAAAYQLATREAGRFPESAQGIVYNWRFCTACLMGDSALALRLIARTGATAVCPSPFIRDELAARRYPPRQLRVIRNAVDMKRFAAAEMDEDAKRAFRRRHGVPPV